VTANLNAAAAALSRKDTVYAKRYLSKIEKSLDIPEYHNTMGVLEMLCGNYDKAASQATEAGLPEAKQNLAEMTKKQENAILIRQQQSKKKQQR
jgi:soluble cytochrome b562